MFEDEMTEAHLARTEAEYRAVTRQEIRDQRIADDRNMAEAHRSEIRARLYGLLKGS